MVIDGAQRDVPLAPQTSLKLGGHAAYFCAPPEEAALCDRLRQAHRAQLPCAILGGGSNVLIPDEGVEGLVLSIAHRGVVIHAADAHAVTVEVAAGEPWDAFVTRCVQEGWAGLECLAGIPGLSGATPIQNVGAYGQEVAAQLTRVRAFDRRAQSTVEFSAAECGFTYRDSLFKQALGRWIVLSTTFTLPRKTRASVGYASLKARVPAEAPLAEIAEAVVALRREKSMVLDPSDPHSQSAGSFFTNPILPRDKAESLISSMIHDRVVMDRSEIPHWTSEGAQGKVTKFAAAWLIEKAGFSRGERRGAFGISPKHALALVHYGGGRTRELLAFEEEIRAKVRARFGVQLAREPRWLAPS